MFPGITLVLGMAEGVAAGGTFRGLMRLELRFEVALLVAFVVQGAARGRIAGTSATSWGMLMWVIASVLLFALLLANLKQTGAIVAAAGVLFNLLVVLANGGMPITASGDAGAAVTQSAGFYHLANGGTLVPWAGDAMEYVFGDMQFMLSPGDVVLAVGVASVIAGAMLGDGGDGHHSGDVDLGEGTPS
jgi:hypothetical protein